jgi:hypothetical protein
VCFSTLALLLPQTSETHGRTQFERFGLLLLCNVNGLLKTGFGF